MNDRLAAALHAMGVDVARVDGPEDIRRAGLELIDRAVEDFESERRSAEWRESLARNRCLLIAVLVREWRMGKSVQWRRGVREELQPGNLIRFRGWGRSRTEEGVVVVARKHSVEWIPLYDSTVGSARCVLSTPTNFEVADGLAPLLAEGEYPAMPELVREKVDP